MSTNGFYKYSNDWKSKDKTWIKSRQIHWKEHLEFRLKEMAKFEAGIYKNELKYYKKFYIKGEIPSLDQECGEDSGMSFVPRLFFKIWFHPEEDLDTFKSIIDDHIKSKNRLLREFGLEYIYMARRYPVSDEGEFFAGRSYFIDKLIAPKSWDEYVGPKPENNSRFYKRQLESWNRIYNNREIFLLEMLDRMNWYSPGMLTAFSFDLFLDLTRTCNLSYDFTDLGREGNLGLQIKWLLNRLRYPHKRKKIPEVNKQLVPLFIEEMSDLLCKGIRPEIDEWWKESQSKPLDI